MHILVKGLGSSFQYPVFLVRFNAWLLSFGEENYGKTALNEVPVHEWQQKVKHVMKEFNTQKDINGYFICLKKPREWLY